MIEVLAGAGVLAIGAVLLRAGCAAHKPAPVDLFLARLPELTQEYNSCRGSLSAIAANRSALLEQLVEERMITAGVQYQAVLDSALRNDYQKAIEKIELTMSILREAHNLAFGR
ncbi:MAG: hypothetical protein K2W95_05775 [Candidatus Obscuribacterales bacterium]|nr:hypothetical protein [Candidatus Obscuribacterales bacterium]